MIRRLYCRKPRSDIAAQVLDFKMMLNPNDNVESQLLFCPHLYDWREIAFLREQLRQGDTFLDAGANVGFYSLIVSNLVGAKGTVLSVEADPDNASRLRTNLQLSGIKNVQVVNTGLSNASETLRLGLNTSGNRGGHSFLYDGPDAVDVECKPLCEVLASKGIHKIDGAKFDIEGFEFRVLNRFFQEAASGLWPRFIIIEDNAFFSGRTGGNVIELLNGRGYRLRQIDELNYFATLE